MSFLRCAVVCLKDGTADLAAHTPSPGMALVYCILGGKQIMKSNARKPAEQLLPQNLNLLSPRARDASNRIADGVHIDRNAQKGTPGNTDPRIRTCRPSGILLADRGSLSSCSWLF